MRSAPNSTRRAATCAGPTRAAAAIAAVVLAPAISRRRGRCAAMAPVTNQVAANTKARIAIAPRGAGDASPSTSDARTGGGARGISSRFRGSPITMCSAAQIRHAAAPAELRIEKGRERPSDRAGKAGDQGDAGDRSARRAAVEPGEGGESRIIKAHGHADAEHRPGQSQGEKSLRDTEQDQPRRQHQIGQRQHAAAAAVVDRAADGRAQHRRQQQRAREQPKHSRPREPEALRDRIGQDRRQVITRSPGERLRRPERGDDDGALHSAGARDRATARRSRSRASGHPIARAADESRFPRNRALSEGRGWPRSPERPGW